jgi:histidine phosphotransferase ChpT
LYPVMFQPHASAVPASPGAIAAVVPSLRPRPAGRRPVARRRPAGRDGEDPRLAELLAARLCHDLSGPIGVAADAEGLAADGDGGLDPDGLALVADSGRIAAARLALFRAAFGLGGDVLAPMPSDRLAALAESALASSRLRFRFQVPAGGVPAGVARLCLCLLIVAQEALPRGGVIAVAVADDGLALTVRAEGRGARLAEPVAAAFAAANCHELTSRTVVGYYARILARRLTASLSVDALADAVRFGAVLPAAAHRR